MAKSSQKFQQPHWWTDSHNSAWDHVREAFRSKWQEQAPESGERARADDWDEVEPAIRFGFGRRRAQQEVELSTPKHPSKEQTSDEQPDWDPELEATLEQEWDSMHHAPDEAAAPRLWHDVRQFVHRGWFGP